MTAGWRVALYMARQTCDSQSKTPSKEIVRHFTKTCTTICNRKRWDVRPKLHPPFLRMTMCIIKIFSYLRIASILFNIVKTKLNNKKYYTMIAGAKLILICCGLSYHFWQSRFYFCSTISLLRIDSLINRGSSFNMAIPKLKSHTFTGYKVIPSGAPQTQ